MKYRILLVEDDELSVKIYSRLLTKWGFEVHYANDGYLALQMLQDQTYDLLLTDNQLPFMSGLELLEKLSDLNSNMPRIMLTGEGLSKSDTKGATLLIKPIFPDYLRYQIDNSLSISALRQTA